MAVMGFGRVKMLEREVRVSPQLIVAGRADLLCVAQPFARVTDLDRISDKGCRWGLGIGLCDPLPGLGCWQAVDIGHDAINLGARESKARHLVVGGSDPAREGLAERETGMSRM